MAKSLTIAISNNNKKVKFLVFFLFFLFSHALVQSSSAQSIQHAQLVSINKKGVLGNKASSLASISIDGRFVAFISNSDNLVPNDINQSADAFLHDRIANTTKLVSISSTGDQANASTLDVQISGNGRYVVFESISSNLASTENQHDSAFYLHDQLTGITEQFNTHQYGSIRLVGISSNGRYIATRSQKEIFLHDTVTNFAFAVSDFGAPLPASNRTVLFSEDGRSLLYSDQLGNLQLYDRVLNKTAKITLPHSSDIYAFSFGAHRIIYLAENSINSLTFTSNQPSNSHNEVVGDYTHSQLNSSPAITLSNDGNFLLVQQSYENGESTLLGSDFNNNQTQIYSTNVIPDSFSLSGDGDSIAYAQELEGIAQIYVQDRIDKKPSYVLSGRVIDASGLPLALVTLQDNKGNAVKTDRYGNFWINGISSGSVTLTPSKEGYIFEPSNLSINVSSDISKITFFVSHDEVLNQAKLNIGMPYDFDRGCETPWQGCGEEFHGFSSGYCTDMILDAYLWGADFNIQTALERDYQANPEHFYRWRNARNAHDMWRYFSYNGLIFPHTIGYLPGDIVFFDWSDDGEIDHVSIISEINSSNQPSKIYDATGVIPSNPLGLAYELPWETFHDDTVRGHARWTGIYGASNTQLPNGEFLQIAASSPEIQIAVFDSQGNRLDQSMSNIPNSTFFNLGWEQSVNIGTPITNGNYYNVQISHVGEHTIKYKFGAHIIKNGIVTARIESSPTLLPGSIDTIYLYISDDNNGEIKIEIVPGD